MYRISFPCSIRSNLYWGFFSVEEMLASVSQVELQVNVKMIGLWDCWENWLSNKFSQMFSPRVLKIVVVHWRNEKPKEVFGDSKTSTSWKDLNLYHTIVPRISVMNNAFYMPRFTFWPTKILTLILTHKRDFLNQIGFGTLKLNLWPKFLYLVWFLRYCYLKVPKHRFCILQEDISEESMMAYKHLQNIEIKNNFYASSSVFVWFSTS